MLPKLNLPVYDIKLREQAGIWQIWDPIRKKYLVLTHEEWVRQNLIAMLTLDYGYPRTTLRVEGGLTLNQRAKRSDIVAFKHSEPFLLVEVKAPNISIDKAVLEQAATYNLKYKAPFLLVSNGLVHWAAQLLDGDKSYQPISAIPHFNQTDLLPQDTYLHQ